MQEIQFEILQMSFIKNTMLIKEQVKEFWLSKKMLHAYPVHGVMNTWYR